MVAFFDAAESVPTAFFGWAFGFLVHLLTLPVHLGATVSVGSRRALYASATSFREEVSMGSAWAREVPSQLVASRISAVAPDTARVCICMHGA